jgi:hypothetical protein
MNEQDPFLPSEGRHYSSHALSEGVEHITRTVLLWQGERAITTIYYVFLECTQPAGPGIRYSTMVTLTKSLRNFVLKIASDIIEYQIRHSTVFLPSTDRSRPW